MSLPDELPGLESPVDLLHDRRPQCRSTDWQDTPPQVRFYGFDRSIECPAEVPLPGG